MNDARPTTLGRVSRGGSAAAALALTVLLAGCAPDLSRVVGTVDSIYDHAEGIRPEQAEIRRAHDVAIFEWAIERGFDEPFSRSDIERAYGNELAARKSGKAAGTAAYGARAMTLWNFYSGRVEGDAQLITSEISSDLTKDEVREYYEQHQDEFQRQDVITVTITEWEDGRALSTYDVTIDATTVRTLQESDDTVISAALDLAEGEQATVDRHPGTYAQLECLSRSDGGVEPFGEVVQAAASQLANQRFEAELQRRIDDM